MTFYDALFGRRESNYEATRAWLESISTFHDVPYNPSSGVFLSGERCSMTLPPESVLNACTVDCGIFLFPSVGELRGKVVEALRVWGSFMPYLHTAHRERAGVAVDSPVAAVTAANVVGDSRKLHSEQGYRGGVFQAASQFNALEFATPDITPNDGISGYQRDRTQGPACAMACGCATAYRNYLVKWFPNGPSGPLMRGQTADAQLNGLTDVLSYLDATNPTKYVTVKNGYVDSTVSQLDELNRRLRHDVHLRDALISRVRVGVQHRVRVTDVKDPRALVTQVYCAALSVGYSAVEPPQVWEPFARLVLCATYEATLLVAMLNEIEMLAESILEARNRAEADGGQGGGDLAKFVPRMPPLVLTKVGGGVFGNEMSWIQDAMVKAVQRIATFDVTVPLRVFVTHFGAVDQEFATFPEMLTSAAPLIGGRVPAAVMQRKPRAAPPVEAMPQPYDDQQRTKIPVEEPQPREQHPNPGGGGPFGAKPPPRLGGFDDDGSDDGEAQHSFDSALQRARRLSQSFSGSPHARDALLSAPPAMVLNERPHPGDAALTCECRGVSLKVMLTDAMRLKTELLATLAVFTERGTIDGVLNRVIHEACGARAMAGQLQPLFRDMLARPQESVAHVTEGYAMRNQWRYVVHVANHTVVYGRSDVGERLRLLPSLYRAAFDKANELRVRSVALPILGGGAMFPRECALQVSQTAMRALLDLVQGPPSRYPALREVVVFGVDPLQIVDLARILHTALSATAPATPPKRAACSRPPVEDAQREPAEVAQPALPALPAPPPSVRVVVANLGDEGVWAPMTPFPMWGRGKRLTNATNFLKHEKQTDREDAPPADLVLLQEVSLMAHRSVVAAELSMSSIPKFQSVFDENLGSDQFTSLLAWRDAAFSLLSHELRAPRFLTLSSVALEPRYASNAVLQILCGKQAPTQLLVVVSLRLPLCISPSAAENTEEMSNVVEKVEVWIDQALQEVEQLCLPDRTVSCIVAGSLSPVYIPLLATRLQRLRWVRFELPEPADQPPEETGATPAVCVVYQVGRATARWQQTSNARGRNVSPDVSALPLNEPPHPNSTAFSPVRPVSMTVELLRTS